MKNAYDADAGMVRVALRNIGRPDASIVVEDDGDGMTLETIRDIWLVPGHSSFVALHCVVMRPCSCCKIND